MRFERPYLLFLALAALLPIFGGRTKRWHYPPLAVIGEDLLRPARIRKLLVMFRMFSLLALAVAVAGPVSEEQAPGPERYARNIFVLLDVSRSMDRTDFPDGLNMIKRIDAAKRVVGGFVEENSGDRIGIIAFGSSAFTLCPLTFDHDAASEFLADISVGMVGDRTALGDALTLAVARLKRFGLGASVVIVVTDGRNTTGKVEPLQAGMIAERYGVPIYPIAIGRGMGGRDSSAGAESGEKDESADLQLLGRLADLTGGKLFKATELVAFGGVISEIEKIERVKVPAQAGVRKSYGNVAALVAAALLAIELLVSAGLGRTVPFGL